MRLIFRILQSVSRAATVRHRHPALAPGIEQMHGAEVISSGFHFGMLIIAVLGALLITGEYATGLIRSTFAAVPTRIPVLAAKALTLVVLTAAVTLVSVTLSYFLTMPRLSPYDLVRALDDPGTWRVFGGTLYSLISAALFSLGVGTLPRSTAASLTAALTVLLLLLPGILSVIRLDWVETIVSYYRCRPPQRCSPPEQSTPKGPTSPPRQA